MQKGILFLSIMDFTDKGIQVIKLTPEYFAKNGWDVHCVVTRNNSRTGSYYYQDEVNPAGVKVIRAEMPTCWLGEQFKGHLLRTIYSKLRGYVSVIKLAWIGYGVLQKNTHIDVIYGSGPHGVLAAHLLKRIGGGAGKLIVARFYGILSSDNIIKNNLKWILLNWDDFLAIKLKSNLLIVTNDGTRGDVAIRTSCPDNLPSLRFWVNGVDPIQKINAISDLEAVTICRLVSWKHVDRALICVAKIINGFNVIGFRLHVIGDGPELFSLQCLARELGIENNVVFHGALKHAEAIRFLQLHDIYFSTYDLSNVGNPLLEAIRANRIIFTLNNGDTSAWISHRENGFIYDINDSTMDRMAQDIVDLLGDESLRNKIKQNIVTTENEKLWTWEERMKVEFLEINKLVATKHK